MRRRRRLAIVGGFGIALIFGGGVSAAAITAPSTAPVSAPLSAWPPAPSLSPTATAVPTGTVVPTTSVTPTTTIAPTATAAPTATPTTTPTKPEPPTKEEIAALFKLWNDALLTGDANKVADRYASDAVLLPTQSNKVRKTREEIIDYFKEFLTKKPSGKIKDSVIKILGPTAAIDTGVYVFTVIKDGKEEQVEARYTFVYELRDGKWLIVNHHSSAMPEPAR